MQRKTINIIGGLALVAIFVYSHFKYKKDTKELKDNMFLTKGTVKGAKTGKSNYFIVYDFNYRAKSYTELKSAFGISFDEVNQHMVGRTFPLLVSKDNPDNTALLIFKEDFKKYGLAYPDSLKWVYDSLHLKAR